MSAFAARNPEVKALDEAVWKVGRRPLGIAAESPTLGWQLAITDEKQLLALFYPEVEEQLGIGGSRIYHMIGIP